MREACGRRDRARAALACAALPREMMGVVGADADGENASGARASTTTQRRADERAAIVGRSGGAVLCDGTVE